MQLYDSMQKKNFILIILLATSCYFFPNTVCGQASNIDSLERLANSSVMLRQSKDVLWELVDYYEKRQNHEKVISYSLKALKYKNNSYDNLTMGNNFFRLAKSYRKLNQHKNSLKNYQQALKFYKYTKSNYNILNTQYRIGYVTAKLGQIETALLSLLKVYEEVRRELKKENDLKWISLAGALSREIGGGYWNLQKYRLAEEYYEKALEHAKNSNDESAEMAIYTNLGILHKEEEQYEASILKYKKAYRIAKKLKEEQLEARIIHNMGVTYKAKGNYEKAEELLKKALNIKRKYKDDRLTSTLSELAKIYEEQGKFEDAEKYYYEAIKTAQVSEQGRELKFRYLEMASFYENQKQFEKAFQFFRKYKTLEDSLLQAFQNKELTKLENQRKEQENLFLKQENETQKLKLLSQILKSEKLKVAKENKQKEYELLLAKNKFQKKELERKKLENEKQKLKTEKINNEKKQLAKEKSLQDKLLKNRTIVLLESIIGVLILLGFIFVLFRGIKREKESNYNLTEKNKQIIEQTKQIDLQNQKLQEVNEEKDNMMHIVAHDLKAPLNKIKGLVNLVKIEIGESQQSLEQYFELIDRVGEDAEKMIKDWLDIKSIENQSWEMEYQEFIFGDLVKEVIQGYEENLEQKQIKLMFENQTQKQIIYSDANTLKRVFDNLISNAIKFSPRRANMWIKLESKGENMKFVVKDEGPGLSEEDKSKLFGKFQKLSARPTAGESSSGLGLSIVKKLVESLDGEIYVESIYGQGATFIVEIPKNQNK